MNSLNNKNNLSLFYSPYQKKNLYYWQENWNVDYKNFQT